MNSIHTKILFTFSLILALPNTDAAVTVTGDVIGSTSDAVALNEGTGGAATPFNLSVGSASEDATSLWVGRYDNGTDAPGGSNAAAIFPFLLPDLGTLDPDMPNPFTNATFTFTTETTKTWNATLQGLDVGDIGCLGGGLSLRWWRWYNSGNQSSDEYFAERYCSWDIHLGRYFQLSQRPVCQWSERGEICVSEVAYLNIC